MLQSAKETYKEQLTIHKNELEEEYEQASSESDK